MRKSSRLRTILLCLAGATLLSAIGAEIYAYRVRARAQELVKSALRIRSTADAKDEVQDMRKRFGNSFREESDHLGGDYNYDAQVHDLSIARFLIVALTVLNRGVAIRNGQLHYVVVAMASGQRGFAPSAHVQEWFGPAQPSHMHASEMDRPRSATVAFTPAVADAVRQKAFGSPTACFTKTRGCRNAEELLPNVWQWFGMKP